MGRQRYIAHSFSFPFLDIKKLYLEISFLFHQVQGPILLESSFLINILHWKIGRLIVEYEQQRDTKVEDHQELLFQLSERLIKKFGKVFSFSSLEECCKFYYVYPPFSQKNLPNESVKLPQLQDSLTWDHYRFLIHIDCPIARNFYEKEAINSNWSPSLLNHFIKSCLFERLSASFNKESVLRSAQESCSMLVSSNNN